MMRVQKPTRLCQKITTYENSYRIPIQREQKNWTLLLTRKNEEKYRVIIYEF